MFEKPCARGGIVDRGLLTARSSGLENVNEALRRALGHSIIGFVIAFGFAKIAYVEARAILLESRGFFRAGP